MSTNVDNNSRNLGHGVYYDKGQLYAMPFSIDPTTKKLLVEIIPRAIGTINVPNRMPIDQNSVNVSGGLTNDSNLTLTPLSVDLVGSPVAIPCLRVETT